MNLPPSARRSPTTLAFGGEAKFFDIRRLVEGFPAGAVMTMARYVAKNIAKEELKGRGVKMSEIEASDINEIANALLETDASIIETAKANFKKLNPGKRYA